ncbi:MAG TPA: magnesium-translocating P-type ATPase [Gemmatales bacterium]|nr:magnesium-translocating P-type ATPase [Gemmatales bacterium]
MSSGILASLLIEVGKEELQATFSRLNTSQQGLSQNEVRQRQTKYGPNVVAQGDRHPIIRLLRNSLLNPLVILLIILAGASLLTGDVKAAVVMLAMVVLGVALRLAQEVRADAAAARLRAMISVRAMVMREGQSQEVPISQLVPGDIVQLAAGDMIPADVRLISCKDLFLMQASLTGETFPVEKHASVIQSKGLSVLELSNICYLGTSVESGSATALVLTTGLDTYLGSMSTAIAEQPAPTSFDRGVSSFTWLMIRMMLVMVPLVFVINGLTKGDWKEAFLFSLAVAVGLTPEMLPMIIAVCLSKGAMAMSRKKVIVKRLNSIQNLGAMDILCTDKTGTLTMDQIILEKHCDVVLREDQEVLILAYLNSHFQTGLKNVMDRAILQHSELKEHLNLPGYSKVDEIPFDFVRRVMSVVVETPEHLHRLICKGAPEEIYHRCSGFLVDGETLPMDHMIMTDLKEEFEQLCSNGFRVLALAYRDFSPKQAYDKNDEHDLILRGYVAFLDPPKDSARTALEAFQMNSIAIKVLTGDNELVGKKICKEVGLNTENTLLGSQVESMSDTELQRRANETTLFARVSPAHKRRIIQLLQQQGHVVGFLGDGINDAPALRAADVGISVDTAVDIAKESADAILLEKDLNVVNEGVLEGRKVFANILKYVRMGASSNFGNMLSVLGASVFLPFVPMLPLQILLNNLLYDFSQVPIPTDQVDAELVTKPRPWSMNAIFKYIVILGPISSIFDYLTYFMLLYFFGCWDPARASLFQTGWFLESLLTQTLIIHVIRTNRIPFLQSMASWPLLFMTIVILSIGISLPYSPLASALGFFPMPWSYWGMVIPLVLGYLALTQIIKTWMLRRGWIST